MIATVRDVVVKTGKAIVDCFVPGRPVVPSGDLGRRNSPDIWTSKVIDVTAGLGRVTAPCELEVEFIVSAERDLWEHSWEMALDNLLKWLLDTLEHTVFRSGPDEETQVVAIPARERVAGPGEETGAHIVIRRAGVPD